MKALPQRLSHGSSAVLRWTGSSTQPRSPDENNRLRECSQTTCHRRLPPFKGWLHPISVSAVLTRESSLPFRTPPTPPPSPYPLLSTPLISPYRVAGSEHAVEHLPRVAHCMEREVRDAATDGRDDLEEEAGRHTHMSTHTETPDAPRVVLGRAHWLPPSVTDGYRVNTTQNDTNRLFGNHKREHKGRSTKDHKSGATFVTQRERSIRPFTAPWNTTPRVAQPTMRTREPQTRKECLFLKRYTTRTALMRLSYMAAGELAALQWCYRHVSIPCTAVPSVNFPQCGERVTMRIREPQTRKECLFLKRYISPTAVTMLVMFFNTVTIATCMCWRLHVHGTGKRGKE